MTPNVIWTAKPGRYIRAESIHLVVRAWFPRCKLASQGSSGPADVAPMAGALVRWLCVAGFHRVCPSILFFIGQGGCRRIRLKHDFRAKISKTTIYISAPCRPSSVLPAQVSGRTPPCCSSPARGKARLEGTSSSAYVGSCSMLSTWLVRRSSRAMSILLRLGGQSCRFARYCTPATGITWARLRRLNSSATKLLWRSSSKNGWRSLRENGGRHHE